MSKAKCLPNTGEIIATSANEIVEVQKCCQQTPLSSCSVEGRSGEETMFSIVTLCVSNPAPSLRKFDYR